jgi:cyclic beta-1,2-glucan synthetase
MDIKVLTQAIEKCWQSILSIVSEKKPRGGDEEQPLHLELFTLDQLVSHAKSLAHRHRVSMLGNKDRLLSRLADNERVLLKAYEYLNLAVKSKQHISPAGEWLLDNFHFIEDQIRTASRHFPKGGLAYLINTPSAEYPRVYDIALEVIAHVDGWIDQENIKIFVSAYQEVSPLQLGEIWAVPIMFRLALVENIRRVASRVSDGISDRAQANYWADRLQIASKDPDSLTIAAADMARASSHLTSSFVAEFVRRAQGQGAAFNVALSYIEHRLSESARALQQLVQQEGREQAANQVSVAASIGSLRFLGSVDWCEFVEGLSAVEKELRKDPAQVYEKMDFNTRDQYRHVVEAIAKTTTQNEWDLAREVVNLASQAEQVTPLGGRPRHIGYYLIDKGLPTFLRTKNVNRGPKELKPTITRLTPVLYFGSLVTLTFLFGATIVWHISGESLLFKIVVGLLSLVSASQVATSLVNGVATLLVKPKLLPKLDFSSGIPEAYRTLVAVPCLLINRQNIKELLEGLETRYLANPGANLHFALLTDFSDSESETVPTDEALLQTVKEGIEALNTKYSPRRENIFFLLHRDRKWNPRAGLWMGYERKRGKLAALNFLIRETDSTNEKPSSPFSHILGDVNILPSVKYVITLDSDTHLPLDSAHKLIGTMAHPLNHPVYDREKCRVTEGYSILQPRVSASLPGSRRSWFARLYSGDSGLDPSTRAVSDVYQDLFHEGSFVGKGIYDVGSFAQGLSKRIPEDLILRHDLLEGCYVRCGLVSDILLYEEFPSHYGEEATRRHRWTRGDWQILFWLLPRIPGMTETYRDNPVSWLSKWKIFDNLRRSVLPGITTLLLLLGWGSKYPLFITLVVVGIILSPVILTSLAKAIRKPADDSLKPYLSFLWRTSLTDFAQALLAIMFLPYEGFLRFDAILRSFSRMFVTKKKLLEWKSASDPRNSKKASWLRSYRLMFFAPLLAVVSFLVLTFVPSPSFFIAIPFVILWFFSPSVAYYLSRTLEEREEELSPPQKRYLHRLARTTWRFFETFLGPEDHFLPPDNFQESPAVTAHRTSPTNLGCALLSNLAAFDFGYLSPCQLTERTSKTFETMKKLERFRGHFYNWYDTRTLKPLPPHYVSTVDSGNLAGLILILKAGLRELPDLKIIPHQTYQGLTDTLDVLTQKMNSVSGALNKELPLWASESIPVLSEMERLLKTPPSDTSLSETSELKQLVESFSNSFVTLESKTKDPSANDEIRWWVEALKRQFSQGIQEALTLLAPWTQLPEVPEKLRQNEKWVSLQEELVNLKKIPTLRNVAQLKSKIVAHQESVDEILKSFGDSALERAWLNDFLKQVRTASERANDRCLLLEKLSAQCEDFANLEYDFLYDKTRNLLSVGYNASEYRRDASFYDLLASEARLTSFVAIAQGHLTQDHWFALGRRLTSYGNETALLSWSGSMFEYLMPLLVMPTYKKTLLDETYRTVVDRQIAYGKERNVPWGISESCYNATDTQLNYQYRAFGVPGLGFMQGLSEDLVIAPYASLLALMVSSERACSNLQRMTELGYEGKYGFYEAIDFTPARLAPGQERAIIRSFMTHHQGMGFLSLAYALLDKTMQRRFNKEPKFRAAALLLHERVPNVEPIQIQASEVAEASRPLDDHKGVPRVITTPNTPRPEVHLLSNGRYSVMLTNAGGGYSRWKNLAVTRWREDPTCDNWGTFCYVRDVEKKTVWSASFQPTLQAPSLYEAIFPEAKVEFRRRDFGIEMHTEITVCPEDDIELRRFSLTNLTSERRIVELTSFAEVALATQAADEAQPAFSNLFVQTEIMRSKQAILAHRRPGADKNETPVLLHMMSVPENGSSKVSFETDRNQFIGRGRTLVHPLAMESEASELSGTDGSVLDPIVAIRCRIEIPPEQTIRVYLVTGVAETREAALKLADTYSDRHIADRVFDLAWSHRQVVLSQLNIKEAEAQLYGRLASTLLYANPLLRADPSVLMKNHRGQSGLWGYSVSGDFPILLLIIKDKSTGDKLELVKQCLQAHAYARMVGVTADLMIWNEEDASYRLELHDEIIRIITAHSLASLIDKPGGIFLRRSDQMTEEDRVLFQTVARAILTTDGGTLAAQLERRETPPNPVPALIPTRSREKAEETGGPSREVPIAPVQFPNGLGGFSADGQEYVITTSPELITPAPWANVIANPHFGTVISESGGAYTWCENAHEFRLTPWHNDALTDRSGEAFYVRDEETGEFWSPTPLPVRASSPYVTKHGFGYSIFENINHGILSQLTTFVAGDAPVKFALIKIKNTSDRTRQVSVTGYCEWVLGESRAKSAMHITTENDPATGALFVRNPYHPDFGGRIGFFGVSESAYTVSCDRSEFLGRNGHMGDPAAMRQTHLSGSVGAGLDTCTAVQTQLRLSKGEERELVFILGVARDVDDAHVLIQRFRNVAAANASLDAVTVQWRKVLSTVQIKTPEPTVDVLINGWILYQVLSSRLWGRSGYYQSGGAFGFRDQLQDTLSLLHSEPSLLREHLLRCASRQFREGDVQHWWHPPLGRGVRTHCSDDYLWLPLATSRYVLGVGDTGVLAERVPFIEGRPLRPDEETYYDLPAISDESATLYDHCVRAIKHGLRFGAHGLPLMGCGDWNDGMNLVGEKGKGESVWLGFFLFHVLTEFAKVARIHGDLDFANTCINQASQLQKNIEAGAWDGEWYRRAYFDSGEVLGSSSNSECQIDSIAQSWSVLSGAAPSERAHRAMQSLAVRLIDKENAIIKLLTPPFDKARPSPGYIEGYVPGVRENGGQYTHAAIWATMAFAALGERKQAWDCLALINPLSHSDSAKKIETYRVEPYVIAADVYAESHHLGRGGWTWYTGSAGWFYRLVTEQLLGLHLDIDRLTFNPCIPASWKEFEIQYRYRETSYQIKIKNSSDGQKKSEVILDGVLQSGTALVLVDDKKEHQVEVRLTSSFPR